MLKQKIRLPPGGAGGWAAATGCCTGDCSRIACGSCRDLQLYGSCCTAGAGVWQHSRVRYCRPQVSQHPTTATPVRGPIVKHVMGQLPRDIPGLCPQLLACMPGLSGGFCVCGMARQTQPDIADVQFILCLMEWLMQDCCVRYGPDAAEVTSHAAEMATQSATAAMRLRTGGVKTIAQRVARHTALGFARQAVYGPGKQGQPPKKPAARQQVCT